MADEEVQTDESPESSGGLVRTALMALGLFVLVIAAQTVASLITTKLGITPAPVVAETESEDDLDADDAAIADAELAPPIYWPLKPPLVVNYNSGTDSSFLQVELEVMARSQEVIEAVKEHTPALRNSLLMSLAKQEGDAILTAEGKEALRGEVLAALNDVLEPYTDEPRLEAVYFTSFVAQ